MTTSARLEALLSAYALPEEVTGFQRFELATLNLPQQLPIVAPNQERLRLGHLAERWAAHLIDASSNYDLLYHSIQVRDGHQTLGELDFLLRRRLDGALVHLEFAYKFYLYDPAHGTTGIDHWIGPNRTDTLSRKLSKLRDRQFPLLHHPCASQVLPSLSLPAARQELCLLAGLYVPGYGQASLPSVWRAGVRGYYYSLSAFRQNADARHHYHLPPKTAWGLLPSQAESWQPLSVVLEQLETAQEQRQSLLCWEYDGTSAHEYFVVWW